MRSFFDWVMITFLGKLRFEIQLIFYPSRNDPIYDRLPHACLQSFHSFSRVFIITGLSTGLLSAAARIFDWGKATATHQRDLLLTKPTLTGIHPKPCNSRHSLRSLHLGPPNGPIRVLSFTSTSIKKHDYTFLRFFRKLCWYRDLKIFH